MNRLTIFTEDQGNIKASVSVIVDQKEGEISQTVIKAAGLKTILETVPNQPLYRIETGHDSGGEKHCLRTKGECLDIISETFFPVLSAVSSRERLKISKELFTAALKVGKASRYGKQIIIHLERK